MIRKGMALKVIKVGFVGYNHHLLKPLYRLRGCPESSSFTSIVRQRRGLKNDDRYHNYY